MTQGVLPEEQLRSGSVLTLQPDQPWQFARELSKRGKESERVKRGWGCTPAGSPAGLFLQRDCAGLRASQRRAIRANLIKTDGPIGGLPPINPALALH